MGTIACENAANKHGDLKVVHAFDLEMLDHDFIVFPSPSGCGKSAIMRVIAGLEEIIGGTLIIGVVDKTTAPAGERGGTPQEIFRNPRTRFVADFIGTPAMNRIGGTVSAIQSSLEISTVFGPLTLPQVQFESLAPGAVILGIRPHDLHIATDAPNTLQAKDCAATEGDKLRLAVTDEWVHLISGETGLRLNTD